MAKRLTGFVTPKAWTNQKVVLYHGTLDVHGPAIPAGVVVTKGRACADFGRGFYTTTIERQARSWAWQLAQRTSGSSPAVIRFEVDRDALAALEALWFVRGSFDTEDFWSLVFHCRSTSGNHMRARGWYDVVVGPVAASWRQRLVLLDVDQASFHTRQGELLLNASNPTVLP